MSLPLGMMVTLKACVKQIRAVGSSGGRLGRGLQLLFADAPLSAVRLVHRNFVDHVDDGACGGMDGGKCR